MKTKKIICGGVALLVFGMVQAASYGQVNQGVTTPCRPILWQPQCRCCDARPTAGRSDAELRPDSPAAAGGRRQAFRNHSAAADAEPLFGADAVPESNTSLPNWHLFVQPQLQQRNSAEVQARELMRTRQQMRVASARHIVPETPPAGAPISGSGTQFLNVGSYFPGVR